jgi:hypothetical protein
MAGELRSLRHGRQAMAAAPWPVRPGGQAPVTPPLRVMNMVCVPRRKDVNRDIGLVGEGLERSKFH